MYWCSGYELTEGLGLNPPSQPSNPTILVKYGPQTNKNTWMTPTSFLTIWAHTTYWCTCKCCATYFLTYWAIPPPSWGLLSWWHEQQTTMLETNGAWTQQATFSRDFTLYMTNALYDKLYMTNDAFIWKRCINWTACLTHFCLQMEHLILAKIANIYNLLRHDYILLKMTIIFLTYSHPLIWFHLW